MSKKVRNERKTTDYEGMTHVQHILERPGMYIGSIQKIPHQSWIFDPTTNKLLYANLTLPEGVKRLFLEILSNAGDNVDASRRMNVNPGTIAVNMDNQWVSIKSEGEPIPVAPLDQTLHNPNGYVLIPSKIFGELLTSSNYSKDIIRMGAGINGVGSKAVNIFSKIFRVRIGDPKRGQEYEGIWENNMSRLSSVKTSPGYAWNGQQWVTASGTLYTGPAYVEISWLLDFARFGLQEYPAEVIGVFSLFLLNFSLTCKIQVSFNGKIYDMRSIRNYARLYWSQEICDTAIIHYEWPNKTQPYSLEKLTRIQKEAKIAEAATVDVIPMIEMMVLDTPDSSACLSYVNGLLTEEGGVHVSEAYSSISGPVVKGINEGFTGKKKGKKNEDSTPTLTSTDVKSHVSMILNCRFPDPEYTSQSKTKLSSPKVDINIGDDFVTKMGKWNLISRLVASLEAKAYKTLTKGDGKKSRHINLEKGEDANNAGTTDSPKCICYLIEGKSAQAYPRKRIIDTPGGKDLSGYYPLQGKPINVTNASVLELTMNKEYTAIKKMFGLREGANYHDPQQRKELRYGLCLITADADDDGKHILNIVLNMFHRQWPSLLQLGMVAYLLTPVVRVFNNDICLYRFYSEKEFLAWNEVNKNHKYTVKYYKGLGSSEDADIKDDVNTAPVVVCIYDDEASNSLELGFNLDFADKRKEWISKWRNATYIDDVICIPSSVIRQRKITSIVNMDLLDYSLSNLFRAIPSYKDGLKKSQRQALYFILKHWNYGNTKLPSMKVARIANACAELIDYHHGEKSLMDTIINMAQDFVGSNNINIFAKNGQFGTRVDGGEDAADGRYSETKPEWWVKYVFQKKMVELVPQRKVKGDNVEPYWIPCDVPLAVINGTRGIATGWSTYIPAHSPYDVIVWLINRCRGVENKPLHPWFNKFKGSLKIIDRKEENNDHLDGEEEEEEDPENSIPKRKSKGRSLETKGKFEIIRSYNDQMYDLRITELPIGRWILKYKRWLESEREAKRIEDIRDNSTTEVPLFYVSKFHRPFEVDEETKQKTYLEMNEVTLKLRKTYGLSNMVLIDDNGFPSHYDNIDLVMESYYQSMAAMYELFKKTQLDELKEDINELSLILKFIRLVIDEAIIIFKKSKKDIYTQMGVYQIPQEILSKVKLEDCTEDELLIIQNKINKKIEEYRTLEAIPSTQMWISRLETFYNALRDKKYGFN